MTPWWSRLSRLHGADRLLLVRTGALLVLARAALAVFPFKVAVRMFLAMPAGVPRGAGDPAIARRVGWAVDRASRVVPGASCLARALCAQRLLSRSGQPGHLRIGVIRGRNGRVQAHAWVESGGRIIVGRVANLRAYTVLSSPREVQT